MKGLTKAFLIVGIVACGLISLKVGLDLYAYYKKNYIIVD